MQPTVQTKMLRVQSSTLQLSFSVIGYGVARYNSAIFHQNNVLVSCSALLKLVDIPAKKELVVRQMGNSQITQIDRNAKYVMVVSFQGLVSLLEPSTLEVKYQWKTDGKEVRHTCVNEEFLAASSEMVRDYEGAVLQVYSLKKVEEGDNNPVFQAKGFYYFPQIYGDLLTVLQYNDPNPKSQHRKDTVLQKKLPITNRVITFKNFTQISQVPISHASQVICAARNNNHVYYLHNDKFITVYDIQTQKMYEHDCKKYKSAIVCLEKFEKGVVFVSARSVLTYMYVGTEGLQMEDIKKETPAVNGNLCIKFNHDGAIFGYNQNGMHLYTNQKTSSLHEFEITNCGLTVSQDAELLAVGDFAGSVLIYPTSNLPHLYQPLFRTCVVMPIRALGWVDSVKAVAIGTTEGGLYMWYYENSTEAVLIHQFDYSINCMEVSRGFVIVGTSHGDIVMFDEKTTKKVIEHKAHVPIRYQDPKQREMFGTMAHFAEIWSLTTSPLSNPDFFVASSSQDQSKKIFRVDLPTSTLQDIAHLKGHDLATTSIDWKLMHKDLGEIFVSCSDDKRVIIRKAKHNFEVFVEIETSTVREWHTLTYLALEPNQGTRVAIGSQNGYLFIYDMREGKFVYAEKVHLGGIEGLVWAADKIITCSSDLVINILRIRK